MNTHQPRFKGHKAAATRLETINSSSTSTPIHKGKSQLTKHTPRSLNKYEGHTDSMQKDLNKKAGGPRMLVIPSGATIQRLQCFKTKRCRFWLEGRCNRGESCTYAHTDVELRCPPDLTKTKLCTRWKRGICDKDADECAYAHGIEDLRETNQNTPINMTPSTTASRNSMELNDATFGDEDDDENDEDDDQSITDSDSNGEDNSSEGGDQYVENENEAIEVDRKVLHSRSLSRDDCYYRDQRTAGLKDTFRVYQSSLNDELGSAKTIMSPEAIDDTSTTQSQTHGSQADLPSSITSSNSIVSLDISSFDGSQIASRLTSAQYDRKQTDEEQDRFLTRDSAPNPFVHDEGNEKSNGNVSSSGFFRALTYDESTNSCTPTLSDAAREMQQHFPDLLTETYFD